jgi:hypothetical protein
MKDHQEVEMKEGSVTHNVEGLDLNRWEKQFSHRGTR